MRLGLQRKQAVRLALGVPVSVALNPTATWLAAICREQRVQEIGYKATKAVPEHADDVTPLLGHRWRQVALVPPVATAAPPWPH